MSNNAAAEIRTASGRKSRAKRVPDHVGKRRLLKLADFLDELPPEKFNYRHWVGDDWKGREDLSCGTTACALGWATTIPSFRRIGLKMGTFEIVSCGETYKKFGVVLKRKTNSTDSAHNSIMAGMKLFGISENDANFLFVPSFRHPDTNKYWWESPSRDCKPSSVAIHIRQFVRERYA